MKIIIANPNSSESMTEFILKSASKKIHKTTELIPLTNPKGTKGIDCSFAEYQSVWSLTREILKKTNEEKPDAIVLAGFGNVGIFALKEVLDIPVVSISEAAQTIACMLGHKFSILTMLKQLIPYQEDLVNMYRLEKKCASIRSINVDFGKCVTEREYTLNRLKEEVLKIVEEDGAEVIVLGCAALCGYSEALQELIGLPVLDPVTVGAKVAEMMVETGLRQSKKGNFAFPLQNIDEYMQSGNTN